VNVTLNPVPANATDVDFKWESQDPSVAAAAPGANLGGGKITILKVGSTVVTVRSGQVSNEIPVEGYIYVEPLIGIRLTVVDHEFEADSIFVLPVGYTATVIALPDPINANTLTSENVTLEWKSDNENVAKPDPANSQITVTGKGKATITISCVEYNKIKVKFVIEGVENEEEES
jgi:uncharacterized protein YjdB